MTIHTHMTAIHSHTHNAQICARKIDPVKSSFFMVAQKATPRFAFLIDFAIMIKCFGVATVYIYIICIVLVCECVLLCIYCTCVCVCVLIYMHCTCV
jgi:amino acid permease